MNKIKNKTNKHFKKLVIILLLFCMIFFFVGNINVFVYFSLYLLLLLRYF